VKESQFSIPVTTKSSYQPSLMMKVEHLVELELTGEIEVRGEKVPYCHFVHHKSLLI
jgi:hypothetical protein